jgi:hypothetical protein
MRLLQLDPTGAEQEDEVLDLHPTMTVVQGLSPAAREVVLRAVRALPTSADPGMGGLLESHGIFFDLAQPTLELLGLHGDVDVVVGPDDIHGGARSVTVGTAEQAALTGRALTPDELLATTAPGVFADLDDARAGQLDAREALEILRGAVEASQALADDVSSRRRRTGAALLAARQRASGEATPMEGGTATDEQKAAAAADVGRLQGELEQVQRGIAELRAIDVRPLQVLVDAIRQPEPVELVPSERAHELADMFERLQGEVDRLEASLEASGRGTRSAMSRLEAARAELSEAERRLEKPEASDEDVAELEAAHEAVLDAESKASGGFGKKAAQRKVEEARATEQEVLDRIGFPTWSSYVMGASLLGIDPMAEERLEQAKMDLAAAEEHWAAITGAIEADPAHKALLDQLEEVYVEAYTLLGGDEPEDLPSALRELEVPNREVTIDELVDALAYQLELVGLPLGPNPVLDPTVAAAEAFLAEAAGIGDRIAELQEQQQRLENELVMAEHTQQTMDAPEVLDLTDSAPVDLSELEGELEALQVEEADAIESVEARQALLDAAIRVESVATGRLKKLAADLAEQQAAHVEADPLAAIESLAATDASFDVGDDGEAGQEAIEFYLLSRLASLRSVSFAGSVPLVIDDALSGLAPESVSHLLDKVDKAAESVQVIYLSDDPVVAQWCEGVGFSRAAVVTAPPRFG